MLFEIVAFPFNTTGCGFGAFAPPTQPARGRFAVRETVSSPQSIVENRICSDGRFQYWKGAGNDRDRFEAAAFLG